MKRIKLLFVLFLLLGTIQCKSKKNADKKSAVRVQFPKALIDFVPYQSEPVFTGSDSDTWDKYIRERGFILFEEGVFKLWYTGYNGSDEDPKYLGYATSKDGIHWDKDPNNPIFKERWTEDIFVLKNDGLYYMYAEGKNDIAHLLSSEDGLHWDDQGDLNIRKKANGEKVAGPYGTPTVWVEDGKWYLFYECNDEAIWLATSNDHKNWVNVQDEPVMKKGPGKYDAGAIAADQIIKYDGNYYMYYHASVTDWQSSVAWSSNIAMSKDLVHWTKYDQNPIVSGDHSSPIVVLNQGSYWLYTMHPGVCLYMPEVSEL